VSKNWLFKSYGRRKKNKQVKIYFYSGNKKKPIASFILRKLSCYWGNIYLCIGMAGAELISLIFNMTIKPIYLGSL